MAAFCVPPLPAARIATALPRAACRARRVRRGCVVATAAPPAVVEQQAWSWRGHRVAYERLGSGTAPPVVVVHGFGSNALHFRRLTTALAAQNCTVFVPDLLGFGESDKPAVPYSPTLWAALVGDFLREVVRGEAVLLGNSIGSQVAVITARDAPDLVRGLILLNCAGGMNQRGLYGDSPALLASAPIFAVLEWLLKQPAIARYLFDGFRSKARVKNILLQQVYRRPDMVDDNLVDILFTPSEDPNAVGVFVEVFTGDPGPRPEPIAASLRCPIKLIWGAEDAWTPVNGIVARAFKALAESEPERVEFSTIASCGHVPFDDAPHEVLALAQPFLSRLRGAREER